MVFDRFNGLIWVFKDSMGFYSLSKGFILGFMVFDTFYELIWFFKGFMGFYRFRTKNMVRHRKRLGNKKWLK